MRVLFISKSIHDVSGAGVGSRMHLNVLKKLVGEENVYVVDVETLSDVCIKAPQTETYMIQELHLPIYHCLCLMLEDRFF